MSDKIKEILERLQTESLLNKTIITHDDESITVTNDGGGSITIVVDDDGNITVTPDGQPEVEEDETLSDKLTGRIYNWKFASALSYIDGAKTDKGKAIIRYLAKEYENIGWVDGKLADRISDKVMELFALEPHLVNEDFG